MNKENKSTEQKLAYNKAYYYRNKELIKIKMAKYNANTERKVIHKKNCKKYYEDNKPEILQRTKDNYYNNKKLITNKFEN
tara:strand:+ start:763 stop:1002 length:240 start_codon:yes stop_codon:yes gene_type:complete